MSHKWHRALCGIQQIGEGISSTEADRAESRTEGWEGSKRQTNIRTEEEIRSITQKTQGSFVEGLSKGLAPTGVLECVVTGIGSC